MTNILVINAGSSSLKYQLIDIDTESVIAKGLCERIGIPGSLLSYKPANGEKFEKQQDMKDHADAIQMVLDVLADKDIGVISDMSSIAAVGHRVLHGGEKYSEPVLINDEVLAAIEECIPLGPLHNPANLMGIRGCMAVMPGVPMVAVFDTAWGQAMDKRAYMYGLPYEAYEKFKVRRYGFHGTSHRYVSKRVCEFLGVSPEGKRIITCHIGNGGSISAIKDGKCQDTSMGLTPLEGLMMGTRSGDIDGGAVSYIMDKEGLDSAGISNLLNKKSGVLGVFGESSDMRDLETAAAAGNKRAILAEQMYFYRIKKYIGAYTAAMGGVDVIVFTAGVGEHQWDIRQAAASGLEFLGIHLDEEKNRKNFGEEEIISTPDSPVKVVVVPTDEELLIASDTAELVGQA